MKAECFSFSYGHCAVLIAVREWAATGTDVPTSYALQQLHLISKTVTEELAIGK